MKRKRSGARQANPPPANPPPYRAAMPPQTPVDQTISVPVPHAPSSGTDSEYELLIKHEVRRAGHTMTYYTGNRIFRNNKQGTMKKKDACFVVVYNFDKAWVIYNLSRSISHSRLMSALSCFFYDLDGVALVCFDYFELLDTAKEKNANLKYPNRGLVGSDDVPGNPNRVVQDQVRGVVEALQFMHDNDISSSWLGLPFGFVVCGGVVKILIADVALDLSSEKVKRGIKRGHVAALGKGVDKNLLQTVDEWKERDRFICSFNNSSVKEEFHLQMIAQYPFLQKTMDDVLQIFPRVGYALNAHTEYNGHKLSTYEATIHSLSSKYCVGSNGWKKRRHKWRSEFEDAFRRANYRRHHMRSLIRLLRNMYAHLWESTMTRKLFFLEVNRYWPDLIEELHMNVYV